MLIYLKRGLLIAGVLLFGLLVTLYFGSVALVEAIVLPHLEARGGQLEIESIRLKVSGVELRFKRYQEADIQIIGGVVSSPWRQLWTLGDGFSGRIHIQQVQGQWKGRHEEGRKPEPFSAEAAVGPITEWLNALPIIALDLEVEELLLRQGDQSYQFALELSWLRGMVGETHVVADLKSPALELRTRVKILAQGQGLALDFTLLGTDWEYFQTHYLSEVSTRWEELGLEVYMHALGVGRGFLDVSGYARWQALQPERLSFTVLADWGASEVFWPQGELLLHNASAGVASDGRGTLRIYAKGAVDSLRSGSWIAAAGDWALRIDDSKLAGELRVGESLTLSLGHDDLRKLLRGSGRGELYASVQAVDVEWLRALQVPGLPEDLSVEMGLQVDATGEFENWSPVEAEVGIDVDVSGISLASRGVSGGDMTAHGNLRLTMGRLMLAQLEFAIDRLGVFGFVASDIVGALELKEAGVLVTEPIHAAFMGGSLQIEALDVALQQLQDFTFKVHLDHIDLAQLASAVPQFEGEVAGAVSGYLVGAVQAGQPLLTDGHLEIDSDSEARLRYDVSGLLTRGMSEGSAAYRHYHMAELAFQDLALKRFSIDVFPDASQTRPFRLELFGESLQGSTVVPVDFKLNVNVDDTAGLLELLRMIQRGELEF
ncbi:YdbH domain-containing protein [Coraliomargarita sp. SDUM461004]|uniref:YdbH domain-containing protein n=1 Tax=Thalassobacterium sedimentorum TaxID=3041258 RepID=A0ABU1AF89_9BACT|nr:YdbH domain-containing protein [Coraliomargarita sp. SDUM461004]MDQ8193327.1 YdbH domain-containing protein [Coraliomargarita sp. SDUM461004]